MSCPVTTPGMKKLRSAFESETISSVKNMVGIWQERERAKGNDVSDEDLPSAETLRELYTDVRHPEGMISKADSKDDFESLLDEKELPESVVYLAKKLGIRYKLNKRNRTLEIVDNCARPEDIRLFKALAVDAIYQNEEAERFFDMTPRERLAAILDWEELTSLEQNENAIVMSYDIQMAKLRLRDEYELNTDSVLEENRKRASASFTASMRAQHVSEFVDQFDKILTARHQAKLDSFAARRDELNKAIEDKDVTKYAGYDKAAEKEESRNHALDAKIEDIGFSVRTFKRLKDGGIDTIGDIVSQPRTVFQRSLNLSSQSLSEVVRVINKLGLSFGTAREQSGPAWDVVEAEYRRELGEIQQAMADYTRMAALKEIGPEAIFDEIRGKYERIISAMDSDQSFFKAMWDEFGAASGTIKRIGVNWYKNEIRNIADCFVALRDDTCKELEYSELIKIDIKLDEATDVKDEKINDDESKEGNEDGDVNGLSNQFKETWMYEFDTVSSWSKMSSRVRHMLYKVPLGKKRTRFGTEYHMPVMQVINTLIQNMRGVETSQEMDLLFMSMRSDFPWIQYIEGQISQDSQLKTELFRSIRRYSQQMAILKPSDKYSERKDLSKAKLNIINSVQAENSVLKAAMIQLSSGVPINGKSSVYNEDDINISAVDKIIDTFTNGYSDDERKEIFTATPDDILKVVSGHPSLISDITKMLNALGFAVSEQDVRGIAARNMPKAFPQKNALAGLLRSAEQAAKKIKDNGYNTVDEIVNEDVRSDARVLDEYKHIAQLLSMVDSMAVESSIRENGKVRYSYVLPSVLDDLIVGLQGGRFKELNARGERVNYTAREFIIEKYGRDPRFAFYDETTGEWHFRNYILEKLANEDGFINYVTLLNVPTAARTKAEQKDLTQIDRLNIAWAMYHMTSDDSYDNTWGNWCPISLPSDSGRMGFINSPFVDSSEFDSILKEAILKELERMTEDVNSIKHLPEQYKKNRAQFCTFPVLNIEELSGYSVQDVLDAYILGETTDQKKGIDDILNDLVAAVKDSMVKKFDEENSSYYKEKVKEEGEESVNNHIIAQSLFQMAISELTNGDPAYYSGYNTGSGNIQKRAKQGIVPLDHMDIFNADFLESYKASHGIEPDTELTEDDIVENVLYIKDPEIASRAYDEMVILYDNALSEGIIDKDTHDSFLKNMRSIKYTDGQAFTSFISTMQKMYAFGDMKKGDETDLAMNRIREGRQQPGDEMVVKAATKSFMSGMVPIEEGDSVRLMPVQHKLSEQIMTASLLQTSGTLLGKSSVLLALERLMEDQHIDTVMFTSCVKVGENGAVDFGEVDPETASEEEILQRIYSEMDNYKKETGKSIIHPIPYSLYGLVSYVPNEGYDETEVPIGVQLQKLLPADMPDEIERNINGVITREKAVYHVDGIGDMSRDEILALYNKLMTQKIEREYKKLTKETFVDRKKLSEALIRACRTSSRNSSYLERAFSLDEYGNFVIPLCDMATLNMSSEFLNSIVKNAVSTLKAPGKQLVSMSAFGVANNLKIEFEYEDGVPVAYKSIDCMLPAWSKPMVERCTDENGIIDFKKLEKESPEMLKLIGVRVPTQFKNFILPLRVVDFLPTILGDTIVTAIDIVVLQDADFDVDKIPTIFPEAKANYYRDDAEEEIDKMYKDYEDRFYDYDKLRYDFKEYKKLGYTFNQFKDERLNDPNYEPEYRKIGAPEGKPISKEEFSKQNIAQFLRPDGPKLEYVKFDPEAPIESQSEAAINNALINVMHGMLTSKAVATSALAAGDTSKFKKIKEKIEKISPKKTYPDSVSDFSTRIWQETRNNDGKQMIAVFANAEAMQAMLQHTNMRIRKDMAVTINGRTLTSLHETKTALSLESISRYIGTGVGASADNAKDAILSVLNFNLKTAPVVSVMLQLGYEPEEIAFFLNIPSIRHYTDTGNFGDYTVPEGPYYEQELPGGSREMMAAIHFGDNPTAMTPEMREYCDTALSVFMHLSKVGDRMRKLSSLARGDSGSTRPHGSLENNLVRFLNYELFVEAEEEDPLFENWEDLVKYDFEHAPSSADVNGRPNPLAQAYISYGVLGAFQFLSKFYPGIGDPVFRNTIKDIIKEYYDGNATVVNVKNVMYSLYQYMMSNYDCMLKEGMNFEESRNYYLTQFPQDAANIVAKYTEYSGSTMFKRTRLYSNLEESDPFISLDYDGVWLPKTRDEFTAIWSQMFYAKNNDGTINKELRKLALELFKYSYYRNGFRFGNGTYAHLAPVEARLFFPGYVEMLKDMQRGITPIQSQSFKIEFLRNKLYDYHFSVEIKGRKPDDWLDKDKNINDVVHLKSRSKMNDYEKKEFAPYFGGGDAKEMPMPAFYFYSAKENRYVYYVKVAENELTGESTYVRTTPLGWRDKAFEYSAKEDALAMVSSYDQDDVMADKKGKKKKARRDKEREAALRIVDRGRVRDKNSSEESSDAIDDEDDILIGGYPVSDLRTKKNFEALLETASGSKEQNKMKKAREKYLKDVREKKIDKNGRKISSKKEAERKKSGGKKSSQKFTIAPDNTYGSTIGEVETACAKGFGTYTVGVTVKGDTQRANSIHRDTPNDRYYVGKNYGEKGVVSSIASDLKKLVAKKKVKSIVLNLTGSYINAFSNVAQQEDIDKYVLEIYDAIKKSGVYVSKVVSSAQPGVPLASARAAIALGYNLEVHPTADYKFYDGNDVQPVEGKDEFLANLSDNLTSKEYKEDSRVYDKEDGPFIIAKNNWTREIVSKDSKTLYVFGDNPQRTSGNNSFSSATTYGKKYTNGRKLKYPNKTSAVIRGCENAYPISTQKKYSPNDPASGRWTDDDIKEFKSVIRDEVNDIIEAFKSGKYRRVVLPVGGLFDSSISDISMERTPKLYKALMGEMERLEDSILEIAESFGQEKGSSESEERESIIKTNPNNIISIDDIWFSNNVNKTNVYELNIGNLIQEQTFFYNSSGEQITPDDCSKIFVILPKNYSTTIESWPKAKLYLASGEEVSEEILFTTKGSKKKYNILTSFLGKIPFGQTIATRRPVVASTTLTKLGFEGFDDNNQKIC